MLAYRGHCLLLSNSVEPLPSRLIDTDARPQPNKPAASPTPKTPLSLHFGANWSRPEGGALLVLAHLRCNLAAIGGAAEGPPNRVGTLFPVRAAWPKVLVGERGSALQIELANMQAVVIAAVTSVEGL